MKKIKCPCCEYYTVEDDGSEPLIYICPVCFWQYDWIAQKYPDKIIGPNRVSLIDARVNFKKIGASEESMMKYTRKPLLEEMKDE